MPGGLIVPASRAVILLGDELLMLGHEFGHYQARRAATAQPSRWNERQPRGKNASSVVRYSRQPAERRMRIWKLISAL